MFFLSINRYQILINICMMNFFLDNMILHSFWYPHNFKNDVPSTTYVYTGQNYDCCYRASMGGQNLATTVYLYLPIYKVSKVSTSNFGLVCLISPTGGTVSPTHWSSTVSLALCSVQNFGEISRNSVISPPLRNLKISEIII